MKLIDGIYYGYSSEAAVPTEADDLTIFNAVDNGKQYRAFNGRWFEQPVVWSDDPASSNSAPSVIPDPETEDGTYVLVLTVADGEATYSWESTGE